MMICLCKSVLVKYRVLTAGEHFPKIGKTLYQDIGAETAYMYLPQIRDHEGGQEQTICRSKVIIFNYISIFICSVFDIIYYGDKISMLLR